ncbi:hypothetical protein NDU88_005018 [Pleurodeles waltl]|uniref:Reverse transcriptase domain-containing protein n=1 Tax=Pleurodeles waltl TaxID=8319 RepID=A0AAV7QGL8_PLEWA|nr:hypothetical protein NDU88_005018 [Pleurodeles waltl]
MKSWFNSECSTALIVLKKDTAYTPRNLEVITSSRRAYKQALLKRKHELKIKAWEDLDKVDKLKDGKLFWEIINRPFFTNDFSSGIECHISNQDWTDYFSDIFNSGEVFPIQQEVSVFPSALAGEEWLADLVNLTYAINAIQSAANGTYLEPYSLDIPRLGPQAVLVLLYADDAVLLALTANGLQKLLNGL